MTKLISLIMTLVSFFCGLFCGVPDNDLSLKRIEGIPYGIDEQQKVDVYIPKKVRSDAVMVFIHSGAWVGGYRNEFSDKMKYYADNLGVSAASVGYRFVGENSSVTYEDMLCDISDALNAIKNIGAANGIRFKNAAFCGLSAGGHLALLYAYKCSEISPIAIAYAVGYAAPADFTDMGYYSVSSDGVLSAGLPIEKLCGADFSKGLKDTDNINKLRNASPITYASAGIPTVIIHGKADNVVPYSNAVNLFNELQSRGIESYLFAYDEVGHLLTQAAENDALLNKTLEEFAVKYLNME